MDPATPLSSSQGIPLLLRCLILMAIALVCLLEPFLLTANTVTALMIVTAQAHFFMGYLYQYRAGKMNAAYGRRYLPVAVLLFGGYAFLPLDNLLAFFTAGYFAIHFFYDERYLLGENPELSGWLPALPTIIMLGAEVLHRHTPVDSPLLFPVALTLSALMALHLLLRRLLRKDVATGRDAYFLLVYLISLPLTLSGRLIPGPLNTNAINFVILAHVSNWYLGYYLRLWGQPRAVEKFTFTMLTFNVASALLFVVFIAYGPYYALASFLGFLYSQPYFHIWSLLHYVATFRATDMRNWVPALSASLRNEY